MYSAGAIATLCRSRFSHERRRRCLQRRAEPSPQSSPPAIDMTSRQRFRKVTVHVQPERNAPVVVVERRGLEGGGAEEGGEGGGGEEKGRRGGVRRRV